MVVLLLERETAVDDVDRTGGKRRLVRCQIDRQRGDFFGRAEPTKRLAPDKSRARRLGASGRQNALHRNALVERRRLDGARTDRVAANALLDEVGGNRLGET